MTNKKPETLMKKHETRRDYETRDAILKLLSDGENARVSSAEAASQLAHGDEYIDLERTDFGVLRAGTKPTTPMGRVLPKKVIHIETWGKIVALLAKQNTTATLPAPS